MKKITVDDQVFILQGEDEDGIYLIDDPAINASLDAKIKVLNGMDETEIVKYIVSVVNLRKYGKR